MQVDTWACRLLQIPELWFWAGRHRWIAALRWFSFLLIELSISFSFVLDLKMQYFSGWELLHPGSMYSIYTWAKLHGDMIRAHYFRWIPTWSFPNASSPMRSLHTIIVCKLTTIIKLVSVQVSLHSYLDWKTRWLCRVSGVHGDETPLTSHETTALFSLIVTSAKFNTMKLHRDWSKLEKKKE
jgi:hypothetical protein